MTESRKRVEAQFPDGSKAVLGIDERGEMFISTTLETSAAAFMARIAGRGETTGDGEATEEDKALFDRMKAALDKIESE